MTFKLVLLMLRTAAVVWIILIAWLAKTQSLM